MADHPYLDDPAFREEHDGPLITPHRPSDGRDPSLSQIAARAAAIRRAVPRRPVGPGRVHWQPPVVLAPDWFDPEKAVGKAV